MNVQNLLNNYLAEQQEKRSHRKGSGKITPSSLGQCFRRQYWRRSGEEASNPPDERALRVFAAGNLFHDFVQDLLPEHETEVKVETEDIVGYADIVTEDEVIDIKSQHSKAFWYMKDEDISETKFANILQVMTYALLLQKPFGVLVFISKDDLCIKQYYFKLEEWREKVEEELAVVRKLWSEGELPPAEPRLYKQKDGSYKEGQYCQFRNKCLDLRS